MKQLAMLIFTAIYLFSINIFASTNKISEIEFKEYTGKAVMKVVGTQKPTFTVFKLREPLRLIIDISNASVKGIESPIVINNNVVKQVITSQFEDDINKTSRIMLSLRKDTKYSVQSVGSNFVLTLESNSINGSKKIVRKNEIYNNELENKNNELLKKEKALIEAKKRIAYKDQLLLNKKDELLKKELKLSSLNNKLKTIENRENQNNLSIEKLNSKSIYTNQLLEKFKTEKEKMNKENQKLEKQLALLKKDNKNDKGLSEKISRLENKKNALNKKLENLTKEKNNTSSKLAMLSNEKENLLKEKKLYNNSLNTLSKENKELKAKLATLEKENKTKDETTIAKNRELKEKLLNLERKNNIENRKLKSKLAILEKENKTKDEATIAKNRELKAKLATLENKTENSFAKLNDLKILKYKNKIVLNLNMKDYKGDFKIFELDKPKRIVLELPNTNLNDLLNKKKSFSNNLLKSVRLNEKNKKTTLVVDFSKKTAMPKYFLKKEKDTLVLTLLTKQNNKFQNLVDVKAVSKEKSSNIILKFDNKIKYSLIREDNDLAVVKFYNVKTPEVLQNTLDFSKKINENLKMASVFQSGKDTILAIKLNKKTKNNISFDKSTNTFVWNFKNNKQENIVKQENIIKYTKAETASYSKLNANISSKRYKGKRISLDFKNADIHDVLELIADVSKVNIITSDEVSGTITIRLRNVQWDKALDVILKTKGLGKEQLGNILRIAPLAILEKEFQEEIDRVNKKKDNKPLSVRLIPVSYARAEELVDQVKGILSKRGHVTVDVRTNMLIIKDISEKLKDVEQLIRNLDTQTPQVLIEGRIVEATSTFSTQQGIQWGGNADADPNKGTGVGLYFPSSAGLSGYTSDGTNDGSWITNLPTGDATGGIDFAVGSIADSLGLRLRITAAESEGNLKIVSSPRISTLDNKEATIETGVKIPIITLNAQGIPTTKLVDAKIKLTVTPHVTSDGSIIIKIDMTKEEPDFSRTNSLGDPAIISKNAKTELLIKDGETAVIGGMYTKKISDGEKRVPFLGKLPIIGWFFKSTSHVDERAELLIFITPRIINRNNSLVSE